MAYAPAVHILHPAGNEGCEIERRINEVTEAERNDTRQRQVDERQRDNCCRDIQIDLEIQAQQRQTISIRFNIPV